MSSQPTLFHLAPNTDTPTPTKPRRGAVAATPAPFSPVDQVRNAFAPTRKLSAFLGFVLGGFVPVATYTIVHREVSTHPALWAFVAGGLVYSATSVYGWAKQTFEAPVKALGFVVLAEGAVTFSHTSWLALVGLLILVSINGICATVALQTRR